MRTILAPPDVIARWCAALRSGEYKQGRNCLYDEETGGYCCLGVLQMVLSGSIEREKSDDKNCALQVPSEKWLQEHNIVFNEHNKKLNPGNPILHLVDGRNISAAEANDGGVSFIEIADAIERAAKE